MSEEVKSPTKEVESADIASILRSSGPVVKCVVLRTAQKKRAPIANGEGKTESSFNGEIKAPHSSNSGITTSHGPQDQNETKPHSLESVDNSNDNGNTTISSAIDYPLPDLVEEIEIDTTPAKNKVVELLGGPFTFLGQYEEEGIVLMARRAWVEDDIERDTEEAGQNSLQQAGKQESRRPAFDQMSIKQLRSLSLQWGVCIENIVEKQDLVAALKKKELELPLINPHPLQPPLQGLRVRGDIVVLKVAAVDEPLDEQENGVPDVENGEGTLEGELKDDDDVGPKEEKPKATSRVPTNEEFFLNYTKDEYLAFATRTDVVPPQQQDLDTLEVDEEEGAMDEDSDEENDNDEDNNDGDDGNDDDDEDYQLGEDMEEMTEEEEKSAMLNIVMSELLRKFREENGRGPDTRELLEIRASVAEQLGVEVATYEESHGDAEEDSSQQQEGVDGRKRKANSDGNEEIKEDAVEEPNAKRVKFDNNLVSEHHYEDDGEDHEDGEQKVPADDQETNLESSDVQEENVGTDEEDRKPAAG